MTNIKRIILSASFISMVFAQGAMAAKDGLPNGQPFQMLESANALQNAAIAENQAAIGTLNVDVTSINLRIDGIDAELNDVNARVDSNSAEIADAFAQIVATNATLSAVSDQVDGNTDDIAALREDLDDLIALHEADIASLYTVLGGVQDQIDDLIAENAALAGELSDQVAELHGLINDNTGAIDGLLLDIISLNAMISTNTTRINSLESWKESVDLQMADNASQIDTLTAELAALKSRVNTYHDPCLEGITVGQTITGELVNDGVCLSDSRPSRGAMYYTFTLGSAKTVTIDMLGTGGYMSCSGGGTLSDPYLYLHQGGRDGSLITYNDDSGCGFNSRITRNLGPGTYTIEATSYHYTQFGTFVLSVQ